MASSTAFAIEMERREERTLHPEEKKKEEGAGASECGIKIKFKLT